MRLLAALFASALLFAIPSTAPASAAKPSNGEFAARVVELTNAERAKAGLPPLAVERALSTAAQRYAEVLVASGCFGHTCGPVPQLEQRGEQAGYHGWRALGENVAGGQQSPERVVQMWMESPGHRDNILNPTFAEIGVGVATGGQYGIYWAQSFGTRGANAFAVPPAPMSDQDEDAEEAEGDAGEG